MRSLSNLCITLLFASLIGACTGDTGPQGPAGSDGAPGAGEPGTPGVDGEDGEDGEDGRNPLLVGPGLEIEILDATMDAAGASLTYRVTDGNGRPLDQMGIFTEGEVQPSFLLASLAQNAQGEPLQYTAYTTNALGQAASESSGSNTELGIGDGIYHYSFAFTPANFNPELTHTVGIQATRNFEGKRYVANQTFNFVPDGSTVSVTREVVTTAACNGCHNPLSLHGNRRREVKLCILCHQPQSIDPESGNTVDFAVMVHKIHMGEALPSVEAGGDYEIIGFNNRPHNYNTVVFPQDNRACETCHNGADGDFWKTRPSRKNCSSCHDLVSFEEEVPEGMEAHPAGPIPDDTSCANIGCHRPTGGLGGIVDKHLFQAIDPATPSFLVTIDEVRNGAAGQAPEVDFQVTVDGAGLDILATPLSRLRFTVAGPTSDYQEYFQVTAANVDLSAIDASQGRFTYAFPAGNTVPLGASGSYAIGIEARLSSAVGNVNAFNPVAYFATDAAPVVARREVVDMAGCNACHLSLAAHGGSRRNVEYCVMCHNPRNTNDERVAAVEGSTQLARSVDFKRMIHGIHTGEDHENEYVLGGFPTPNEANPSGTPVDFTELRFPGDRRACGTCHIASTFSLPLADGVLASRLETLTCTEDPAADADDLCEERSSNEFFLPPTTAVCTSCHDSDSSAAHAEIMTTASGQESCATCHGPGSAFDIAEGHQLDP